ncbi:sensory rhodopsin transducer [Natronobacterium gregoryi]|uniref:sensory rhodopsin transducer n=1 Tax=Natronobacterium gregoryi TaxID=44930 RepID=UPI0020C87D2C|nr:sensory rhodopsin transducer [Natronobacterium gregoryi]
MTVYFSDRPPAGPCEQTGLAERTKRFRFDEFEDPETVCRQSVPARPQGARGRAGTSGQQSG